MTVTFEVLYSRHYANRRQGGARVDAAVDPRRMHGVAKGDRRALLLYVLQEMSYREIADTLGVTVAAVKSRLSRARAALTAGIPHTLGDQQ